MKTKTKLLILLTICVNSLFAQKFAGGEIRARQTGTYSVDAIVDIFTSINDELPTIELCWGDGNFKPTEVLPSSFNVISLDSTTSDFIWSVPQLEGNYVLALCVRETRNGALLSEYTRKMIIAVDAPLSNEEVPTASQITFTPNPARDWLTIGVPEDWKEVDIAVFDALGRKVVADFFNNQLNLAGLDSGLYWVQVKSGERFFCGKVVVE